MDDFDYNFSDELTDKQKKFIICYIKNNFNATKAAIEAGYSKRSAVAMGSEVLRKPYVKREVGRYCQYLIKDMKNTLEYKIISKYTIRAFYDTSDIVDAEGHLIVDDLKKLGDLSYCIDGIETEIKGLKPVKNKKTGETELIPLKKIKVKLCDRDKSLEQLSKYMRIMADLVELSGQQGGPIEIYNLTRIERRKRIRELEKKHKEKKKK